MFFAIVEDLLADQINLMDQIQKDCALHQEDVNFSCYKNAEDFLSEYQRGIYSAVFMDIILEQATGLDAARQIRSLDAAVPVIFITSQSQFALESYHVHALDYLVKPIKLQQLSWCMERIRDTIDRPDYIEIKKNGKDSNSAPFPVLLDDLVYAETIRNGLLLHTTQDEIKIRYSFQEFIRLLPDRTRFCEFCRGLLVNFSYVACITAKGRIELTNGEILFCSRRKIKSTQSAFSAYQFSQLKMRGAYS